MDGFSQNSAEPPPGADVDTANPCALATSFVEAIEVTSTFAIATFKQEIERNQLYYHGLDHINDVARRAQLIFNTVLPFYLTGSQTHCTAAYWERQRRLLRLSAITHDMLQIFAPQTQPHSRRQRHSGHSEQETFKRLHTFITQLNQSATLANYTAKPQQVLFTQEDIETLRVAIAATICHYDKANDAVYQPALYRKNDAPLPLVAHCLALADISTLGIDGIKAYQKESSLLFIEENLDILPFLDSPSSFDSAFRENLRQRLLKQAQLTITFAQGRLMRLDKELEGLPVDAITVLKRNVFKHLMPQTIHTLKSLTPTAENTSLTELLNYFQLKQISQASSIEQPGRTDALRATIIEKV